MVNPAPGQIAASAQSAMTGLTTEQVQARSDRFGPNEPAPARSGSLVVSVLHAFMNPLVVILLISAVISASTGDRVDAIIIGTIVLLSGMIDFVQTHRSQRVAPTATVLRDGEWKEMPRRGVVPGDVIRLSAGDLVPADSRLLVARDLYVQQAALTGHERPVACIRSIPTSRGGSPQQTWREPCFFSRAPALHGSGQNAWVNERKFLSSCFVDIYQSDMDWGRT